MVDTSERQAGRLITHELIAIYDELRALLPEDGQRELVNRLDRLWAQACSNGEDHVLRIAGQLCIEYGQPELWEQIYREAMEGCSVEVGDEQTFLGFRQGRLVRVAAVEAPHPN